MKRLIFLSLIILSSQILIAQRIITGKVTDKDSDRLPGVAISIKDTTIGTMTLADGTYSIEIPANKNVLIFSFIGFEDKEVKILENSDTLNVQLEDIVEIYETLLVTYGVPRKEKSSAYYTRKVFGDEIYSYLKTQINNNYKHLGNCQPMFVIDGVIYNEDNNACNISALNPEDVYKIEVLKGSVATTKYGSRATNGVILITTYYAKNNGFKVSASSNFSIDIVDKLPELQTTYSQGRTKDGELIWQGANENESFSWGPKISDISAKTYDKYDFFKTGFSAKNTFSINKQINYDDNYNLALSNNIHNGIIPNNKSNSNYLNLKLDKHFGKKIETKLFAKYFNVSANNTLRNNSYSPIFYNLLTSSPSFNDAENKNKSYNGGITDNPYFSAERNLLRDKNNSFTVAFIPTYKISDEFEIIWLSSVNINNNRKFIGFNINSAFKPLGEYIEYFEKINLYNSKLTFDYYYSNFNNFLIDIDANIEFLSENIKTSEKKGKEFLVEDVWGFTNVKKQCSYYNEFEKTQLAGNINSSIEFYRSIYLTFAGRVDKNYSVTKQKTLFSKSVGLSIILSELFNYYYFADYAKIYTSFGTKDSEMPFYAEPYFFNKNMFNLNMPLYAKQNVFYDNNLQIEKTSDFETGFDFRFFHNKLRIDFSYQNSKTKNKYVPVNINERNITIKNAGQINSETYEGSFYTKIINKNTFKVSTKFKFIKSKNIVRNISNEFPKGIILAELDNFSVRMIDGDEYGVFYGTKYSRNSDGKMIIGIDGFPIVDVEQGVIGNPNPDFIINMNLNAEYHNFVLSAYFDYKKGGDIWNGTKNTLNYFGVSKETADLRETTNYIFDGVNENGEVNTIPADFANPANSLNTNRWIRHGKYGVAEDAIEDGTWFRLNSLEIKYKFPFKLAQKIKSRKLELSAFAQNLFTITKYSGINPDANFVNVSHGNGIDFFNFPSVKSYGLNLTVEF